MKLLSIMKAKKKTKKQTKQLAGKRLVVGVIRKCKID